MEITGGAYLADQGDIRVILVNIAQLGVVLLAGVTWEKWFSSSSISLD